MHEVKHKNNKLKKKKKKKIQKRQKSEVEQIQVPLLTVVWTIVGEAMYPPADENTPTILLVDSMSGSRSTFKANPRARRRATPPSKPVT